MFKISLILSCFNYRKNNLKIQSSKESVEVVAGVVKSWDVELFPETKIEKVNI